MVSDDQLSVEREEEIVALKYEIEGLKKMLGIAESGVMDQAMIKSSRENTLLRPKKSKSYSDLESAGFNPYSDYASVRPKLAMRDSMEGLNLVGEEDDLTYNSTTRDSI